jgi:hypothetical protein
MTKRGSMISTDEARRLTERFESRQGRKQSRDLESEFWGHFIPKCVHWKTGERLKLFPYQVDALKKIWSNQKVLLHWGRQCGKTLVVALFLAFMSRWRANQEVVIASFGEKQSKLMLRYVRLLLMRHEDEAYRGNVEFASVKHLAFKNGSRVDAVASGQVSRGIAADVIVLDEAELVSDDDYSALLPTKLATSAKQILLGTEWGLDNFWYQWTRKPGDFHFAYSRMTSVDAVRPNGPISAKDLTDLREELESSGGQFEQECLLIPLSGDLRWFPPDLLEGVFTSDPYPSEADLEGHLLIGVDPATSSRDESVAYPLLQLPDGSIEEALPVLAWHGTPAAVQVEALKLFTMRTERLRPVLVVDQTSAFGITFCDLLEAAGVRYQPFTFSSQSKAVLYTKGKTLLERGVRLRDAKTKHQLAVYHFRESETTKGRFKFGQRNIPDDRADALMLALWGLGSVDRSRPIAMAARDYVFGNRNWVEVARHMPGSP